MPDFFEELASVAGYLDPEGKPCIVYSFSSDNGGDMQRFRARFVVDVRGNSPPAMVERYGLPSLYHAWGTRQGRLPGNIEDRAYAFDEWLRNTPEDEIKAEVQPKSVSEYHEAPATID